MAAAPDAGKWRNRIVGHGFEDPAKLLSNPKNWRIHPDNQAAALSGSLDEVGWVDEITVNRRTGFVVDGHLRAALAIKGGEKRIPTKYVDLSESEEALILASKDSIAALAGADQEKLQALLGDVDIANEAIDNLLFTLLDEAKLSALTDETKTEASNGAGNGSSKRRLGDIGAQIKPVLYAEEVAVFERAIRLTGKSNRGSALIEICRAYLTQAGQLDL